MIGTHFFSPANVMRLLEIVRGKKTSKEVIATCMQLAKKIGKIGVLVGNCRGFVGNRMFVPYIREAQFLVEEGATTGSSRQGAHDWGMAMGPLAIGDLAGLDVGWRIRKEFKAPRRNRAVAAALRGRPTRARWDASARRPERAGTNMTRTAGPRPIRRSRSL